MNDIWCPAVSDVCRCLPLCIILQQGAWTRSQSFTKRGRPIGNSGKDEQSFAWALCFCPTQTRRFPARSSSSTITLSHSPQHPRNCQPAQPGGFPGQPSAWEYNTAAASCEYSARCCKNTSAISEVKSLLISKSPGAGSWSLGRETATHSHYSRRLPSIEGIVFHFQERFLGIESIELTQRGRRVAVKQQETLLYLAIAAPAWILAQHVFDVPSKGYCLLRRHCCFQHLQHLPMSLDSGSPQEIRRLGIVHQLVEMPNKHTVRGNFPIQPLHRHCALFHPGQQ